MRGPAASRECPPSSTTGQIFGGGCRFCKRSMLGWEGRRWDGRMTEELVINAEPNSRRETFHWARKCQGNMGRIIELKKEGAEDVWEASSGGENLLTSSNELAKDIKRRGQSSMSFRIEWKGVLGAVVRKQSTPSHRHQNGIERRQQGRSLDDVVT